MVDIVEEEVDLHLVDTSQLVAEAKKLKEAQRIKKQNDKLQKQLTFSKPSIKPPSVIPVGVNAVLSIILTVELS